MTLTHDDSLTSDLAGIIGYLRVGTYQMIARQAEAGMRTSAEGFIAKLADHLRFEEEVLFPVLREIAPGSAADLERLQKEHQRLRSYARDLACKIVARDEAGAYGVSRAFLVALLDHIGEETRITESIAGSLDAGARARLRTLLNEARARTPEADGPDLLDPPCGT